MVTFLTSAKAFMGQALLDQARAISSWKRTHPEAEVMLFGEAEGAHVACKELGVVYIPEVECSESGIPLFNSIVRIATDKARHDIQIYLNCDIVLTPNFLSAIGHLNWPEFMVIGRRITVSKGAVFDETSASILNELRALSSLGKAKLDPASAIDYFIFPRGLWTSLPPVIIGRAGYDNALIAHCLRKQIPMIDATFASPVLHPEHEYRHVAGGLKEVIAGRDAILNLKRNGITHSRPSVTDADWRLEGRAIVNNADQRHFLRSLEIKWRFVRARSSIGLSMRAVWRILNAMGLVKHVEPTLDMALDKMAAFEIPDGNFRHSAVAAPRPASGV